ncbi:MAG: serine/threonine protein phosphatase 1 [Limisphaerales bacterium]
MRSFAISDIHGCQDTFRTLLFDRLNLTKSDKLYLLGDYIDRGPSSKGVLDIIRQLGKEGYQVTSLKGNHDDVFFQLWLKYNEAAKENWEIWGGTETLVSFGAYDKSFEYIPDIYFEEIEQMKNYVALDDYLLVHAGFNFSKDNIFEDKKAMCWAAKYYPYIDPEKTGNRIIVHGHTPLKKQEIIKRVAEMKHPVICIDAGCCYDDREDMGYLCALQLENRELIFQERTDEIHAGYE